MKLMRPALSLLVLSASAAALAPGALAQSDDPLDSILACRGIQSVEARLACFDAAAGELASARDTGALVAVTREDVEAVERDSFGFNLPSLPRLSMPAFGTRDRTDAFAGALAATESTTAAGGETAPARPEAAEGVQVTERAEDGQINTVRLDIERIREVDYRKYAFYMSNGQVWRMTGAREIRYNEDGENYAEITRGALGSFLLRINGQGRAHRVRRDQ